MRKDKQINKNLYINSIQNFINYSYLRLIILNLSLFSKILFKFVLNVYLLDYIYVFSFEVNYIIN